MRPSARRQTRSSYLGGAPGVVRLAIGGFGQQDRAGADIPQGGAHLWVLAVAIDMVEPDIGPLLGLGSPTEGQCRVCVVVEWKPSAVRFNPTAPMGLSFGCDDAQRSLSPLLARAKVQFVPGAF